MDSLLMRRPLLTALPELGEGVGIASAGDEGALAELLSAAFDEGWDVDRVRRDLLNDPTVTQTFVIRDGVRIVATASARNAPDHPGAGYLHWVATDPVVRGRGLGRKICVAVLHDFAATGLEQAVLETDDPRLAAIKVYLGLGFVPVYPGEQHQERWSAVFIALAQETVRRSGLGAGSEAVAR